MRFVASVYLYPIEYPGKHAVSISCSQVPVESLVKLIGIMDKHVIDTAELQMNVLPVSLGTSTVIQLLSWYGNIYNHLLIIYKLYSSNNDWLQLCVCYTVHVHVCHGFSEYTLE